VLQRRKNKCAYLCYYKTNRMRKNKGQTLVEFILIFVVLLVATIGVLTMYKTFWKNKIPEGVSSFQHTCRNNNKS
jgi:uncharacterized protein (UPF0333 family)